MRFTLRMVAIACALAFGASQVAMAGASCCILKGGLTKMSVDAAPCCTFAVMSRDHKLYFVSKAGKPGVLAKPGTYKLSDGELLKVGPRGVILDPKMYFQFTDPAKLPMEKY